MQAKQTQLSRTAHAIRLTLTGLILAVTAAAYAGPVGEDVVQGSAEFTRNGASTIIDVHTQKAIINYDSFNIAANEYVRFNQLSNSATVLNRIQNGSPTTIDGTLSANGRVFFVNPAGVMFGSSAVVDVAGIYAAAGNISNQDFMNDVYRFTDLQGEVINAGSLNAEFVALVGKRVVNDGIIFAPDGLVAMAAGDEVLIGEQNGRIMVKVDNAQNGDAPIADVAAVVNNGQINAEGGQATLAAGDMYWLGVKQTETASTTADQIIVEADNRVDVSGTLDASNQTATGGEVQILAEEIALYSVNIDARGLGGGGDVYVGGDYQGGGDLPTADNTFVGNDGIITVDALFHGDGGTVIVWADIWTGFYGQISARGGDQSGNGGFVEVSGKQFLQFNGMVDTRALNGEWGTLLLDPTNIIIADGGPSADDGELPTVLGADGGAVDFTISEQALEAVASGTNISLEATNNITINDLTDNALTLDQTGSVTFTADSDNDSSGDFVMSDTNDLIDLTGGGTLGITAQNITTGDLQTANADITLTAQDDINAQDVTAGSGAINLSFGQDGAGANAATLNLYSSSSVANTINAGGGDDTLTIADVAGNGVTAVSLGTETTGDTFVGPDINNAAWSINAADGGVLGGVNGTFSFSDVENVTGGSLIDAFTITNTGDITGTITGGAGNDTFLFNSGATINGAIAGGAGDDALSMANYNTARSFDITAQTANGFTGTEAAVGGGFAGINEIRGASTPTTDALDGLDTVATFTLDDGGAGRTYTTGGAGGTLTLTNIETFTGGTAADTFNVQATTAAVTLDGQGGDDIYNLGATSNTLDNIAATVTINDTAGASDTLNLRDAADTDPNSYTVNNASTTRGALTINHSGVDAMSIFGGNASDTYTVNLAAIGFDVTVDESAGGANDSLVINGDAGLNAFTTTATSITTGGNSVNFTAGQLEALDLQGAGNADTLALTGTLDFANSITINVGGAVTDAGGADPNLDTIALDVTAGSFGDGDAIEVNVNSLTIDTSATNGNQQIIEADALTALDLNAGGGNVTLSLSEGTLVDTDGSVDVVGDAVSITLADANDGGDNLGTLANPIATTAGSLSVTTSAGANDGDQFLAETDGLTDIALDAGSANVTLTAGGAIDDAAADGADVIADTASITAGGAIGTTSGLDTSVDSLAVDTSGANANQTIVESDGLTALNLDAGNGDIDLTLTAGGIADTDTAADLTATNVSVTLPGAFGAFDNLIDTAAGSLTIDTSAGNASQFIDETNALTDIDLNAGAGSIVLDANGAIDDAAADGDDITAASAIILANGNVGGTSALDTALTNLDVTNTGGSIAITNTGGLTLNDLNIGGFDDANALSVSTSAGGSITAASPITISADATHGGSFTYTASGSAADNDDITIDSGVTVTLNSGAAGNLTFDAGDDIIINGTGGIVTTGAAHTVVLNADTEGAGGGDADRGGVTQVGAGATDLAVSTSTLDINAHEGIFGDNNADPFQIAATTITADNTGAFDVNLKNFQNSATQINSLTTAGGDITFDQVDAADGAPAGGALTVAGPLMSGGNPPAVAGGNIALTADGGGINLAAAADVRTTTGAGGTITLGGGVSIDAAATIDIGAGNLNLNGGGADYLHTADFTFDAPVNITVDQDILVDALLATTAGNAIVLTADGNTDGTGGFRVSDPGQVNSGDALTITGTDLAATAGTSDDAIVVIADAGGNPQLVATGAINLDANIGVDANAFMSILGDLESAFAGNAIVLGDAASIRLTGTHTASDANGDIVVENPLVLVGNAQFVGNDVTFQDTINDDGSVGTDSDLQIDADGVTAFQGDVGTTTPINSITTDAPGTTVAGNAGAGVTLHTDGSTQTYNDPFLLAGDTTLIDDGSGVFFNDRVDGDGTGPYQLIVNTTAGGTTRFGNEPGTGGADQVGGVNPLASLITDQGAPGGDGTTIINTDLIATDNTGTGAGQVTFNDAVSIRHTAGPLLIDTTAAAGDTGAPITFAGTLNGNTIAGNDLTLDAGTGFNIDFDAAVGGGTRIGNFIVSRAQDVTADAGFTAASVTIDVAADITGNVLFDSFINTNGVANANAGNVTIDATGTVTVNGPINAIGATNPAGIGFTGGDVVIDGADVTVTGVNTSGGTGTGAAGGAGGLIDIDANDADPVITINEDLTSAGGTGTTQGAGGNIVLGDNAGTTDTINFGALDIVVSTGNTAGNIDFNGAAVTGSGNALTLTSGTGNITFDLAAGNVITNFDDLIVTLANDVTIANGSDIAVGSIDQQGGSGTTTFGGTVTTSDSGGVVLSTNAIVFRDDVTVGGSGDLDLTSVATVDFNAAEDATAPITINGGGSVLINNGGLLTIVNGVGTIDLNGGGSFSQTGAGAVSLGANIFTEQNGGVLFSTPVTLTQSIEIDTDRGDPSLGGTDDNTGPFDAGNVQFLDAILATASESLTIDTGAGDISVTGDVGNFDGAFDAMDLTDLTIIRANNVQFLADVEVQTLTQQAGAGGSPSTLLAGNVNIHDAAGNVGILINTPGTLTLGTAGGGAETLSLINEADATFTIGDAEFLGGADSIVAGGAPTNVSILTIQPNDVGGNMTVGAGGAGGVNLSNTDVNAIADGFELIFLGRADGTGTIAMGNGVTFKDPLFVRTPGTGGLINIAGIVNGTGNATLVFDAPTINLGGTLNTEGQDIAFIHGGSQVTANPATQIGDPGGDPLDTNAAVVLTDNSTINTNTAAAANAGDVFFEDTIDSETGEANDLTITAADNGGTDGDLLFGSDPGQGGVTGRIGGNRRLGALTINDARDVTFGHDAQGAVTALSFDQNAGSGNTTFNGAADVLGDGVLTSLQTGGFNTLDGGDVEIDTAGDVTFDGAIVARGGPVVAGVGRVGGNVDLSGANISVKRIDVRGSAGVGAAGGNAGVIALNAISDDGNDIIIAGDLLATGGVVGGFTDGNAGDITLGDTPATEQIVIDPDVNGVANGWSGTADTVTMEGHDVLFDALVDANGGDANAESLYVNTFDNAGAGTVPGTTRFNGVVGGNTPLENLITDQGASAINGVTVINAAGVTVNREITINDPLEIDAAAVTITSADTIRFNNTVNAVTGEADTNNLRLSAANAVIFDDNGGEGVGFQNTATDGIDGIVGGSVPLNILSVEATGTTFINTSAMDGVAFEFNNPVQVALDTTLTGTGADPALPVNGGNFTVLFDGTIDSFAGELNDLTVVTTGGGTTRFNGNIGTTDALGRLQTDLTGTIATTGVSDGVTEINAGTINLNGASAEFNDPVVLFTDVTITEVGAGNVVFNEIVDSDATGPFSLTVNTPGGGNTIFRSEVGTNPGGGFTHINNLITDAAGTTEIHADMIAVTIDINDPLLIGLDVNNTNTVGTDSFGQNIDGVVTIGEVGTTTDVTFDGTVDSLSGQASNLTLASVNTTFNGNVGSTDPLGTVITTDPPGPDTTTLNADTFAAAVWQFQDPVTISNGPAGLVTLTGTTSVTFENLVDSVAGEANSLTVNSPLTLFDGPVGNAVGNTFLGSLITDAAGTTTLDADQFTAVTFDFNDSLIIDDAEAGAPGLVTIGLNSRTTTVNFDGTVDSAGGEGNNLTVNSAATNFNENVGASDPLGTVTTTDALAPDTTTLNADTFIADVWDFEDPVVISNGPAGLVTVNGTTSVSFQNTVDSVAGEANSLTINSPITLFDGDVGNAGATTFLGTLLTDAAGTTTIDTDNVIADDVQFDDAVVIEDAEAGAPGLVTVTGNNTVTFNGTVDSATGEGNNLTVNSPATVFDGDVGQTDPLGTLTTDDQGATDTTTLDADNFEAAIFVFNDMVLIDDAEAGAPGLVTIQGNTSITFSNTLDSTEDELNNLTLDSPLVVFGDAPGDHVGEKLNAGDGNAADPDGALGTLTVQNSAAPGTGLARVVTERITAQDVDFAIPVSIDTDNATNSARITGFNSVLFQQDVDSQVAESNTLVVNTGGDPRDTATVGDGIADGITRFQADVGQNTRLNTLATDADGLTYFDSDANGTGVVNTGATLTGSQTHNDGVVLEAPMTFDNDAIGITFNGTVDSEAGAEHNLTLDASGVGGNITFNGVVGDSDADDDVTNTRLGDVLVTDVNNLLVNMGFKAVTFTQSANGTTTSGGRGNTTFAAMAELDTSGRAGAINGGDILILTDGSISLLGGADTSGLGGGSNPGDITLQQGLSGANGGATTLGGGALVLSGTGQPHAVIQLGGNFDLTGGNMVGVFNIGPNGWTGPFNNGVPTVSTIFGNPTGADVMILADVVNFGDPAVNTNYDKSTFFGNLVIDVRGGATQTVTHGDLAAVGNLRILTDPGATINMKRRPAALVLRQDRLLALDLGMDVGAGGVIEYDVVPTQIGAGPNVLFFNPGANFDVENTLLTFVQREFGSPIIVSTPRAPGVAPPYGLVGGVGVGGIVLDLASIGPSNANAAEALAAAIPTPEQSGDIITDTIVGDVQRDLLVEAGVDVSDLPATQRLEFLAGRQLLNDIPANLRPRVARALVTDERLKAEPVAQFLEAYEDLFLVEGTDPQTGEPIVVSRHIEIRRSFDNAWIGYQRDRQTYSGEAFVAYLRANQEVYGEALDSLRALATLHDRLLIMGLSPREVDQAMRVMTERVTPDGMTVDQLYEAVMTLVNTLAEAPAAPAEPVGEEVSLNVR